MSQQKLCTCLEFQHPGMIKVVVSSTARFIIDGGRLVIEEAAEVAKGVASQMWEVLITRPTTAVETGWSRIGTIRHGRHDFLRIYRREIHAV
jgi:hypothetical protein